VRFLCIFDHADGRNESITSAGNRFYVLPASFLVPKRFPQHRQIVCQIALFHNSIRPNRLHQLVFADELPVILN
jgi:hypothetical protein